MISLDLNGSEKGKGLLLALYNKTQVVLGRDRLASMQRIKN